MWLCHVWYAHSPDLRKIVFTSNESRRHSMEIKDNPSVSGGVVAIPLEGLGQEVRGLVFSGTVYEAQTPDEIDSAYALYEGRWPKVRSMFSAQDVITEATPMRMYVLRPNKYSLWDKVNYPDSPQQALTFDELDQANCPYCGGFRVTNVDADTGILTISCVRCLRSWRG